MKNVLKIFLAAALLTFGLTATASAKKKILKADEVEALIKGKTVSVLRKRDGKQWRIYFAPDGKGYESKDKAVGTWKVTKNGKHCNDWAKLKCASIADFGNGTYGRLIGKGKRKGKTAVFWTKIIDGNDL